MKLRRLLLKDFRGFSEQEIVFNENSTVIFGINGSGKSSILRSINLLYANIINRLVNRKELRQQYNIELNDIKHGRPLASIEGGFVQPGNNTIELKYERKMERKTGKRTHSKSQLDLIVRPIQDAYIDEDTQGNIPIFVNYGTNRLVLDIPLRIKGHHDFDIYSAYEKAIENRIDFRTFFEWYRNQEDAENAYKVEMKDFDYADRSLNAVRNAISAMMPQLHNIRISRKPRLAMLVEKDGINFNIAQLSDGEKCVLAMFGDLAKRLSLANPRMENPLLGEGVVLIDEIELHMHPLWQRKILGILKDTFPNIQFIITTHSPIVLSEVNDDYNALFINNNGKDIEIKDLSRLDGYDINFILEEFMGTSSRNEQTSELVRQMYEAINLRDEIKAKQMLDRLRNLTNDDNEDVIMADMIMRRKGFYQ